MAIQAIAALPEKASGCIKLNEQPNNSILLNGQPVLSAIVGSQAYGLAGPDSDYDYLGIYVADTDSIRGLYPKPETICRDNPDMTFHELGKFVRLALQCNPTILELLFVGEYHDCNETGEELVAMRSKFLSRKALSSYIGCAIAQVKKLGNREEPEDWVRYAKHARHCFRLLQQGHELATTGSLTVRVPNPQELLSLGGLPYVELKALFEERVAAINEAECVLPDEPDKMAVSQFLVSARGKYQGLRHVARGSRHLYEAVVPDFAWVKAWGGQA